MALWGGLAAGTLESLVNSLGELSARDGLRLVMTAFLLMNHCLCPPLESRPACQLHTQSPADQGLKWTLRAKDGQRRVTGTTLFFLA
jgi:hypothetical protein